MTAKKTARTVKTPQPLEHHSQAAFFEWWELYAQTHRLPAQLCFAVPNGGHRHVAVAKRMKAEGVKRGVSDVFLLIPAGGFHGLLMEFKRKGQKPTKEQEAFLYETRRRGYNAVVVYSTEEAIQVVRAYLSKADRNEDKVPIR